MSYILDLSKELRSYEREYLIPTYGHAVEWTEKVLLGKAFLALFWEYIMYYTY